MFRIFLSCNVQILQTTQRSRGAIHPFLDLSRVKIMSNWIYFEDFEFRLGQRLEMDSRACAIPSHKNISVATQIMD